MNRYVIKARYGYFFGFSANGEPLFTESRSAARCMGQGHAAYRARMLATEGCGQCYIEPV